MTSEPRVDGGLLPPGKIPIDVLEATVLKMTGARSLDIVTPPKAGLDFSALKLENGFMIISADPITGVSSAIGRYAIMVSSNDVATSGNRPQFAETVVLLPQGSQRGDVAKVARQMDGAAKEAGIAIVGGHTEVTPGLLRPIVMATVFSFVKEYVSSGDAEEGDTIMMTKTAGLEGTAALARERGDSGKRLSRSNINRAERFLEQLSVIDDAEAAFKTGHVHAMHDCTEGGVLGASYEMSFASGVGFELEESSVPVAPETRAICQSLGLDPLKLIGSGSLLIAIRKGKETQLKETLTDICRVTSVGHFTKRERVLIHPDGSETKVRAAPEDELWRALGRRRDRRFSDGLVGIPLPSAVSDP